MDLVQLAIMGLDEAKQFQKTCEKKGIELILNHNEASCRRGCAVTVEILGKVSDIAMIQDIYQTEYQKLLKGHDVNDEQLNAVYDLSQPEALCPACGHKFSPGPIECPDCGLGLG